MLIIVLLYSINVYKDYLLNTYKDLNKIYT